MKIEIVSPIECRVKKSFAGVILPCLSYQASIWRKGKFAKERQEYTKHFFSHKEQDHWYFWTGLLPRVEEFCANKNVPLQIIGHYRFMPTIGDYMNPHFGLPNITFRKDQIELIQTALKQQRGIIKSPTGSGKTLLQLGILSAFPDNNAILLAHTVDLVKQTYDELIKFGFKNVGILGGRDKNKTLTDYRLLVSTMQSFSKLPLFALSDYYDIVIIDEAHHVSKEKGLYAKILSKLLAPVRLGFTATLPTIEEAKFTMEGLLGPLIGEVTIDEAVEIGILAKPKVKLIKSPFSNKIRDARKYADVYDLGITNNKRRNQQIVDIARKFRSEGKTSLIMVNKIEHGENIAKLGSFKFIQGRTSQDSRDMAKKNLISKRLKCLITTCIWREGINIPSLDVVINAGGGKSEIATLQAIGRGLRKTDEKSVVTIVDFFDPSHPYLISHFGERVTLYMENNWL